MSQLNIETAIDKELFEFRKQLELLKNTTDPLLAAVKAVEDSKKITITQVQQLQELADSYVSFVEDVKYASVLAIETELAKLETKFDGFINDQGENIDIVVGKATVAANETIVKTANLQSQFDSKIDQFNEQTKSIYEAKFNEFKTEFNIFVTELKAELHKSVSSLNSNTEKQETSHNSLIQSINEIIQSNKDLITSNMEFIALVNGINFPMRLDKIDNTVSAVNIGLQNVQTKIDTSDREVKEKIENQMEAVSRSIESTENNLKIMIGNQQKQINLLKIFMWISIGITLVFGIINIYKSSH